MISMTSIRNQSSRILCPLLAACIVAGIGSVSALAADMSNTATPPPQAGSMHGQVADPSGMGSKKATCTAEAKSQGLKGAASKHYIDQCLQG